MKWRLQGLNFIREYEMDIYDKERKVGNRRVDFLVEDKISVDLKTLINLEPAHLANAINYLEAYNIEKGLLINFSSQKLVFNRLENKKLKI